MYIGDIPIKRVKETKALGVYIDAFLSWNKQKDLMRNWGDQKTNSPLICAYNALVLPHFVNWCEVWDTSNLTF